METIEQVTNKNVVKLKIGDSYAIIDNVGNLIILEVVNMI